jgi:hypothetical protein
MPKLWDAIKTRARFAKISLHEWRAFLWFAVLLALFALPYGFSSPGVSRVQWQGMLFQWAGVSIVAWGLADTRRRVFGKEALLKELWSRLQRLSYIIKPPPPITGSLGAIELGDSALIANAQVRVNVTGTLDERIADLTENLRRIDETLSVLQQEIRRVENQTADRIDSEQSERQTEDQSIRTVLEKAIVGGIHLEFAGVGFLLVGILFTSVPDLVASQLQEVGLP